ncbi:MAG: molybdopterin-binding protein, partial [candidate division KSB1 bacterium]|nr:molybdopterin-binding protein [candidate division KSB1 bacterium]
MTAEIISIGDEVLIGQIVNTNASYLGQRLTEAGMEVNWVTAVGDDEENLRQALENAISRARLVITTGGLGPTHDDITKKVVAQFFNSPLVFRPDILEKIKERFQKRGVAMPKINEDQAWVPDKAQIIENRLGSAVGFIFAERGKYIIVLPGVPAEMKAMMEETVLPFLQDKARDLFIKQKTLRTTGIFESALFEKISADLPKIEKLARVAFLPKPAGVDIRLTAKNKTEKTCLNKLSQAEKKLRQ